MSNKAIKIYKLHPLITLLDTKGVHHFESVMTTDPRYKRLDALVVLHCAKLTALLIKQRHYLPIIEGYIKGITYGTYKKSYKSCVSKIQVLMKEASHKWEVDNWYKDTKLIKGPITMQSIIDDLYYKEIRRVLIRYTK